MDSRRDRASSMSGAPPGSPSSRPSPTARRRADTPGRSAPAGDEARARGTDIGGGGHDDGEDVKKDKEDHERLKLPYVAIGETMRLSEGEGDAMEYFYFQRIKARAWKCTIIGCGLEHLLGEKKDGSGAANPHGIGRQQFIAHAKVNHRRP